MIEAEIVLGALETFLDGPTQPSRTGEFGKCRACRREDEVVGALIGMPWDVAWLQFRDPEVTAMKPSEINGAAEAACRLEDHWPTTEPRDGGVIRWRYSLCRKSPRTSAPSGR
jgi:hypothetical protein